MKRLIVLLWYIIVFMTMVIMSLVIGIAMFLYHGEPEKFYNGMRLLDTKFKWINYIERLENFLR